MKKKKSTAPPKKRPGLVAENREGAFKAYLSCGGNLKETVKELRRVKLSITEKTLQSWIKTYRFKQRLDRADATLRAEVLRKDDVAVFLSAQAKRYMEYLSSHGTVDHVHTQASYALVSILKTMHKFMPDTAGVPREEKIRDMQERAALILEQEFGVKRRPEDIGTAGFIMEED